MLYGISWVEWFGYTASVVVAVSLMMSSIVKLRWFNLAGSTMFSVYGFIIGAWPVGFLNLFIAAINIVYLARMYRAQDDFRIMAWAGGDEYLDYFLAEHRAEIARYFPRFDATQRAGRSIFFLIKNSVPIGLLIGRRQDPDGLLIELDYVGPRYRDFRMGSFLYDNNAFFARLGYTELRAAATGNGHDAYLERMGFVRQQDEFVKKL